MKLRNLDKVRVKEEVLNFFKQRISQLDAAAELYVFGSRADISKKGGDIDLLILSEEKLDEKQLRQIKYDFWAQFGEQKVDVVNYTFEENPAFKELIMLDAIRI